MRTSKPSLATQFRDRVWPREAGFTLIEALIAVIILIFGLIAVAQLLAVAAASNTTANRSSVAAASASQELERLQTVPFATLAATAVLPADITAGGACGAASADRQIDGVGTVRTCWEISAPTTTLRFLKVRAQVLGPFSALTRAEFTTFRSPNGPSPTPTPAH